MTETDALRILSLDDDCSADEVRQAYVDLVKVWHPDRFNGDARLRTKAERTLQDINEAYELLQDRSDRRGEPRPAAAAPLRDEPAPDTPPPTAAVRTEAATPLVALVVMGVAAGLGVVMLGTLLWWPSHSELPASPAAQSSASSTTESGADGSRAPQAGAGRPDADSNRSRPQSGIEIVSPQRVGGGSLVIYNRSQQDAVVALAATDTYERAIYVRAGEKAAIANVAPGTYRVLMTLGRDWTADRFSREPSYRELDQPAQFVERADDRGTEFTRLTVSLEPVVTKGRGVSTTGPFRLRPQ